MSQVKRQSRRQSAKNTTNQDQALPLEDQSQPTTTNINNNDNVNNNLNQNIDYPQLSQNIGQPVPQQQPQIYQQGLQVDFIPVAPYSEQNQINDNFQQGQQYNQQQVMQIQQQQLHNQQPIYPVQGHAFQQNNVVMIPIVQNQQQILQKVDQDANMIVKQCQPFKSYNKCWYYLNHMVILGMLICAITQAAQVHTGIIHSVNILAFLSYAASHYFYLKSNKNGRRALELSEFEQLDLIPQNLKYSLILQVLALAFSLVVTFFLLDGIPVVGIVWLCLFHILFGYYKHIYKLKGIQIQQRIQNYIKQQQGNDQKLKRIFIEQGITNLEIEIM